MVSKVILGFEAPSIKKAKLLVEAFEDPDAEEVEPNEKTAYLLVNEFSRATSSEYIEKKSVVVEWNKDFEAEIFIPAAVDRLSEIKVNKVAAYFEKGERKEFFYCIGQQLVPDDYWENNMKELGIDVDGNNSVKKYLLNMLDRMQVQKG